MDHFKHVIIKQKAQGLIACLGSADQADGEGSEQMAVLRQVTQNLWERLDIRLCIADEHPWFTERYHIVGTPTYLLFKGGREVRRLLGKTDVEGLLSFIRQG